MFKLEDMEKIDISTERLLKDKNGRFNPFHSDPYSMRQQISEDVYMMFDFHKDEPFRYCYFVNVKTGERQQLKHIESIKDSTIPDAIDDQAQAIGEGRLKR